MASRSTSLPANRRLDPIGEEHLARLTDAAYRVALQHGLTGSFLDLQLDLWAALRQVLAHAPAASFESAGVRHSSGA